MGRTPSCFSTLPRYRPQPDLADDTQPVTVDAAGAVRVARAAELGTSGEYFAGCVVFVIDSVELRVAVVAG